MILFSKIERHLKLTQRRIHLKVALEINSKATDLYIYAAEDREFGGDRWRSLHLEFSKRRSRTLGLQGDYSIARQNTRMSSNTLGLPRDDGVIRGEWTVESARADERQRNEGRRRLAGKTDHPDVYPSLWCHVLIERARERERKRARATTSARRDASVDARNRRFRDAKQESWSFLNRRLSSQPLRNDSN